MQKIFNSTFEVSLRLLLLLSTTDGKDMTLDRIAAFDFISIYSRDFGLSDVSLHGDNEFGLSEYASRRSISQKALQELVLDGAVTATSKSNGYCYSITPAGKNVAGKMISQYATEYKKLVKITENRFRGFSDIEVIELINGTTEDSLRR